MNAEEIVISDLNSSVIIINKDKPITPVMKK